MAMSKLLEAYQPNIYAYIVHMKDKACPGLTNITVCNPLSLVYKMAMTSIFQSTLHRTSQARLDTQSHMHNSCNHLYVNSRQYKKRGRRVGDDRSRLKAEIPIRLV
jgi:hypothetical protein